MIDWDLAEGFDWPDPDQAGLYQGMDEEARAHEGDYLLSGIFMLLFERLHSLRGFANCLTDLYTDRTRIEDLADRVVAYDLRVMDNVKAATGDRLHGFTFTDDWQKA